MALCVIHLRRFWIINSHFRSVHRALRSSIICVSHIYEYIALFCVGLCFCKRKWNHVRKSHVKIGKARCDGVCVCLCVCPTAYATPNQLSIKKKMQLKMEMCGMALIEFLIALTVSLIRKTLYVWMVDWEIWLIRISRFVWYLCDVHSGNFVWLWKCVFWNVSLVVIQVVCYVGENMLFYSCCMRFLLCDNLY